MVRPPIDERVTRLEMSVGDSLRQALEKQLTEMNINNETEVGGSKLLSFF